MSEIKYSTYSAKPSMLSTGAQYGVNEMAETALSMGMQNGRRTVVEGVTGGIENDFAKDMIQDGLSAGIGYFSGQLMQKQEALLDGVFNNGAMIVTAWYSKSKLSGFLKSNKKGRKASMASRFLGDNDNKAEECRLIADFVKINSDSQSNAHNPNSRQKAIESKFLHESNEVQKEGVRSNLAKLQIDGMRDTFEMKMKTSSFFNTDKKLIRDMTGLNNVTDKDIKKLNSLSASMVFEDSSGNWIGGNEAMISLINALKMPRL